MRIIHREDQEQRERALLSFEAAFSSDSEGRDRSTAPDILRNDFQRDRDKILHSKSFRRLSHKTQVFLAAEGDHYRTRLTHTLEVAQIARTIARALGLNEDLTEAISLGHDLGHTPFGHAGEEALSRCLARHGRQPRADADGDPRGALLYRHNEQSLRVVERIENGGKGLNLTPEVRDGILRHTGSVRAETLEGRVVATADRIAYVNHDIDDAIRAGILHREELPRGCIATLGDTHGKRLNTMIMSIVESSAGKNEVVMSDEIWQASMELRAFLFQRVYSRDWAAGEEEKADHVVESLYRHYVEHPGQMPLEYVEISYREGIERSVCDFIACMTDRYAVSTYQRLFIPASFDSL